MSPSCAPRRFGSLPKAQEGLATRGEHGIEEELAVVHGEAADQVIGHGEDDVEVVDGEQSSHAALYPAGLRQRLTARAVAVSARVKDRSLLAAIGAHVDAPAQDSGSGRQPMSRITFRCASDSGCCAR